MTFGHIVYPGEAKDVNTYLCQKLLRPTYTSALQWKIVVCAELYKEKYNDNGVRI